MRLPSLFDLDIDLELVNFFNQKLDQYKNNDKYWIDIDKSCTFKGIQSSNLLEFDDESLYNNLNSIKTKFENLFEVGFEYHWVHLIEYEPGGYQKIHSHDHNEDFSFVLYLNDCVDGHTVFMLNEKRNIAAEVKPTFGKSVIFLSSIKHFAKTCTETKRVLVCGLKLGPLPDPKS